MSLSLSAHNLAVDFQTPQGTLSALGPLDVTIPPGQFVCLIGPSGCGKSTLVRVFAGLQPPTHGSVMVDNRKIDGPSPRVSMMFQQANLMPWRTVQDNITLPLELAGVPRMEREGRAGELLHMLKLDDFARSYPGSLSGGMAQRAALGRLLAQGPEALLLDEPFGALDAMTREQVGADLLRVWGQIRQTVLMVTHDINEAVFLADRVLVMSQRPGRLVADLTIDLPRPRRVETMYEPEFTRLARQVRAAIEVDE